MQRIQQSLKKYNSSDSLLCVHRSRKGLQSLVSVAFATLKIFFKLVTFLRMRNDPRRTEPVTSSQIRSIADELERFVVALRLAEETAKTQANNTLGIYYWSSAEVGLKRLASFIRSADESRRQAQIGKPMAIGEFKPRSTAKKLSLELAKEAKATKNKATKRKKSKPE